MSEAAAPGSPDPALDSTLPSRDVPPQAAIGPYQLLQMIGEGGMGEVWLAEQKHPVRRRVAVKLIKAGMDSREIIARFESERQALALMDHPTIAKVYDAGSTDRGLPYFAMEYVRGLPITAYCDDRRLTLAERLKLFIRVCEGVQHAHHKAIIHRDLKPSNILVAEVDGKPEPKIIDFGVAKALSQRLTAATMFTRAGSIIGTPEYMSPEQAGSVGEDADTRADVYSLGVILYEMLVGAPPHEYRNLSLEEMLRKLREEDARAPSSRVRTMGGQSTAAARHRRTEPRRLTRQLRGDLDSIALKALEKERGRRYGSPSELAADLERYLRNEPIAARSAGVLYQARKFFARHRAGVAAGLALAALLAAFAVTQAAQLRRITRERDRADLITNFMISMFRVSDPSEARGRSVTARELLDQASTGIDTGLTNDPLLRARMMQIMGTVYANLGIYTQAESLFQRAEGIRSSTLGRENPETLRSVNSLVDAVFRQGRYAEAEKMARASLEVERRVLGPEHPETLSLLDSLAGILDKEGRYREAERMLRDTLAVERRVLGPANPATLRSLDHLASFLKGAEAEKLSREVFDTRRRILGPKHPETLASMNNLAIVLADRDEAEKLMLEAIQIERRVLGPDHPNTRKSIRNAVILLMGNGKYREAESLQNELLESLRRTVAPTDPSIAAGLYTLGCIYARSGQADRAITMIGEALRRGFTPLAATLDQDPDLASLKADPRLRTLERYRQPDAGKH